MAQRASPRAIRLGYNQDWNIYYFAKNKRENLELAKKVKVIQDHFYSRWNRNIAQLKIELNSNHLALKAYVAETSLILGENNQNLEKILHDLYRTIGDDQIKVDLNLIKIKNPYTNAQLVSNMIADQLEKRLSFRRVLNFFLGKALEEQEVKGIWIKVRGRLDGAEQAQEKKVTRKKMPLSTMDIRIEEGESMAVITKGVIGIKVVIYKGKVFISHKQIAYNIN
ncbi:MAG: 30S ribosomal protein S3 [Candidatus Moeniiplasma glomeromycotorum]|nr:30S ribosomal protein S3 [Candidatus Moeniiplasma glomeromycotorum]MCE8162342.1 30S ribosomal protein S3 [Candidatus Moeniiplasma glomeromycotorum]MCE8166266.1 30S ribosomal protein S3 [Candidatus Moeniiplasma glomeromycotorum]MCE8166748.1 30S ribosomal protein S3 [Candidatus Moeniiplasma glomeromycotorum]